MSRYEIKHHAFTQLINQGKLQEIIGEVVRQSKVEFNYNA
jgi:hypothetical protein